MIKKILFLICTGLFISVAQASLIITEFLADPNSTADAGFEYFEVFNNGSTAINVGELTIGDNDADSVSFSGSTLTIGVGEFFVFGENLVDADLNWNDFGSFTLANGADEIVISDTSGELARLDYTDGDAAGDGVANVLNNISNATATGVTFEADYIGEVVMNDTLSTGDIGSPGSAGSTVIPEPSSALLVGLSVILLFGMRRK